MGCSDARRLIGIRFARVAVIAATALHAAPGLASFIHELPRPPVVLQLHPAPGKAFLLEDLDRALDRGASAVELDLRYRPADRAVVCAHDASFRNEAPTLAHALDRILQHQGGSSSVRGDGLQFFVVLDLKETEASLYQGVLRVLRDRAERWSTSATPGSGPRGITILVTGKPHARDAFRSSTPPATLDSLCIVEGVDYGDRILDLSERLGTFQWIALDQSKDRSRIERLRDERSRGRRGAFNVRVYGGRSAYRSSIEGGFDAVNVNGEDLESAVRLASLSTKRAAWDTSERSRSGRASATPVWILQGWKVAVSRQEPFERAWAQRERGRVPTGKDRNRAFLMRDENSAAFRAVERWKDRAMWRRFVDRRASPSDTAGLKALEALSDGESQGEWVEIEDRFGARPARGDYVRFYQLQIHPGARHGFVRAWDRANRAIVKRHRAALGAALLESADGASLLEIVRWSSEAEWRRFAGSPPPDPDADATIRAALRENVIESYTIVRSLAPAPRRVGSAPGVRLGDESRHLGAERFGLAGIGLQSRRLP